MADEMTFRDLNKRYKKEKYEHRSTLPPRLFFNGKKETCFLLVNKITSGTQGIKPQKQMQSLRTEVLYCTIMHGNHNRQLFNQEAKGRSLIIITMKKEMAKLCRA